MMANDMVDEEKTEKSKHEVNPMRVLYRAFKMAYDMMTNRRETLRQSVEEAREVEQQYSVMKRSADQLVQVLKEYQENVRQNTSSKVSKDIYFSRNHMHTPSFSANKVQNDFCDAGQR